MSSTSTNPYIIEKEKAVKKQEKEVRQQLHALRAAAETNKVKKTKISSATQYDSISRAATEYALALSDPFEGPLATIPDFPSVPSRRTRVFSRGFFSTGTNQIGFCVLDPYASATNNLGCVFGSQAGFAGTAVSVTIAANSVFGAVSNSDYAYTAYGPGTANKARVVSSGLRIRYSSTELNRGGVVLGIQTPNHVSLTGLTFAQIDGYECSGRFRPSGSWITVRYCPVFQDELIYTENLGSPGGLFSAYTVTPILGFMVQSPAAGTPISFEYEAFTVYEVQGVNVRGLVPSVADPAGFAAVQTTVQSSMMRPTVGNSNSTHGQRLLGAVNDVAHHTLTGFSGKVVNSGVKWLESAGIGLLSGLAAIL